MLASRISVFGTAVAMVILVDLATGQGPPMINAYRETMMPPPDFRPPPIPLQPVGYIQRGPQYEPKQADKEYGKLKDESKKYELGKEKEEYKEEYKDSKYKTTAAPGVLSSFSNSMSDAWKSFTAMGRQRRSVPEDDKQTADNPSARSFEQFEYLQMNNQGYIYFKVPKNLVCNNGNSNY